MYTYTCTHIHTHIYTHQATNKVVNKSGKKPQATNVHVQSSHALTRTHTPTYTHARTHPRAHTHTHVHRHVQGAKLSQPERAGRRMGRNAQATGYDKHPIHTRPRIHIHKQIYAHTHVNTHRCALGANRRKAIQAVESTGRGRREYARGAGTRNGMRA